MSERIVRCSKCTHYYITYDPKRPYGCRIMGFKSRITPARMVYSTSGMICQLYTVKNEPGIDPEGYDRVREE